MDPITNDLANEHRGSPDMPPPIGEAAALVARLLSEYDQPVNAAAQSPAMTTTAASGPAPVIAELFATEHPSLNPQADRKKRVVLRSKSARGFLPRSHTTSALIIIALAVLIFGSGLAVGYGILGRGSSVVGKSSTQEGALSAVRHNAASETIQNPANLPNAVSALSLNSTMTSPLANSPAIAGARADSSSNAAGAHNSQSSAADARRTQTARTHTMSAPVRAANDSAVSDHSVALLNPEISAQPDRQAATAQLARTQVSDPSSATQALASSAQPVHPERDGIAVDGFENVTHTTSAPQTLRTPAPSGVAADSLQTQVLADGSSDTSAETIAGSPGHVDPSQLVHSVQPVYPVTAKQLHVEGDVELRVVVGVDGTVRSVGLVSGPASLVMAAIDAARQFRYKPALLNGKPIETVQTIEMSFKLKN